MKKLFLILSLVATLVFTGCSDNDNSVNPQPMGKATITGIVYADFDETNNTDKMTWDAVANTKLNVTIWQGESSVRYAEVTTDASGAYTIEVDLGNQELEVSATPVDFRHDVKTVDGTVNRIFTGGNFGNIDLYVTKGGSYIRDSYYND
jgi:hypothetical protein